jgi:glycolate oxidase
MADREFYALHEVVAAARANLGDGPWGYLSGGAETETTVARNRAALDAIAFRPRVLRDVSSIDASATLLGQTVRLPVLLAPVGQLNHFHRGAAATVAEAATEFGIPQILSSGSPPSLQEVAAAAPGGLRIYQLYVTGDAAFVSERIAEVREACYDGFCVTVDTAKYSRRERDIANRWGIRWRSSGFDDLGLLAALSWSDIERMRSEWSGPLVLKGIATTDDARLAVEHGVDVVYVSNHGGRQLDHGLGSAAVLPEIVDAVAGRAQVYVDGSFNRGADIVKAIALGADGVGIGRTACYGLAAAGRAGLVRVLELLEDEIVRTLGLLGVTRWDQLDRSYLAPGPQLGTPGVLSAYPLLDTPLGQSLTS